MCVYDLRLTSRNASVTLCKENVKQYCSSAKNIESSTTNTTYILHAHKVRSTSSV